LNRARQRKLEARAHRQEVLHPTAKSVIAQFPQPKELNKKERVIVDKLPNATESVKRGRGRPRKSESDNNITRKLSTSKKATGSKKILPKITKEKKNVH